METETPEIPQPTTIILVDFRSGKHPWVLYLLFVIVGTGAAYTLGVAAPTSVEGLLSPWWATRLWGLCLFTGGILSIFAIHWKWNDIVIGLKTERIGKWIITIGGSVWTVAIFVVNGPRAWSGVVLVAVFAIGSVWRIAQIHGSIKRVRAIRETYGHGVV